MNVILFSAEENVLKSLGCQWTHSKVWLMANQSQYYVVFALF